MAAVLTKIPLYAETQPEVIAHHYTEGELLQQAVEWWYRAALHAIARSAEPEATGHLHRGLAILGDMPRTDEREKLQDELEALLAPLVLDDEK